MDKVGIGIVGLGNISAAYLKAAQNFPVLDIRAVADLNPEASKARAEEFGMRAVGLDDIFNDPSIDIILNLTIPRAHVEVGLRALEAGKHVYSEKPLGIAFGEGKRLVDAAAAKGLRVGSAPDTFLGGAHQLRHHPVRYSLRVFSHECRSFVVIGKIALLSQNEGVVLRKFVFTHESISTRERQLRKSSTHVFDVRVFEVEREEVGIWEITIVVSFFFRTHCERAIFIWIVETCLLHNLLARFDAINLTLNLVVDRFFDKPKRVDVFNLNFRSEFFGAYFTNADVAVATKRSFFKVAVTNTKVAHDISNRACILGGFGC
ncbi:MAG: Gfo/Idh/MocA family oxidoreductase [Proteobacteria bacterium]|nr:MAG: Gfo/Idh/MocA family oxidoreductase [Pseudomonadota bacterium]